MRELLAALLVAAASPGRPGVPPAVSSGALAAELRESNRRRLEELAEIQRERVRLEQLVAEIALARRELAREAALLEERAAAHERAARERPTGGARRDASAPAAGGADLDAPDPARVESLAKTLRGMKPDHAAAVAGRLEKPLAVAVLRKLRPADAAAVLGRMPASSAAELFTLMSRDGAAAR